MKKTSSLRVATLVAAAAALAGCASSDRMLRVSPLSEQPAPAKTPDRPLDDDRVNVFPLYYGAAGVHAVLWPLVDWDSRGMAVRPLFNREGENASVLFPLSGWDHQGGWALNSVWNERGFLFLPFAGKWNGTWFAGPAFSDGGEHFGCFPVFGRYGDTTQVLNVLVTAEKDGTSTVAAYPFYYDSKDTLWISELYAWHRDADGGETRRSLGGALYRDHTSKDGKDTSLWVFPIGYFADDHGRKMAVTLPYSSTADATGGSFNLHPFWWSKTHGENFSRTLFPLYTASGSVSGESTLTPLWSSGHEGDRSWMNIHPLWWSSTNGTGHSRTLVPLFTTSGNADAESTVSPLWSSGRRGSRQWLNIHPLWWSSENGVDYSRMLIPFFMSEGGAHGDSTLSLLWSEGREGEKSWFNIHPLWWSSKDKDSSSQLLAPLYFASDSPKESFVVTPLWSRGHTGPAEWLNIHPLWWSSDSPTESNRLLIPLLWSQSSPEEHFTLTPLWSSGHTEKKSWFNIHPLWWSEEDDESFSETLFPFYTHDASPGASATVTPLWSVGHSGEKSHFNIHPLWWSSESPKGSSQLLIPFHYAYSNAKGDGTVNWLWSAGHEGERSWFNLHPFWWSSTSATGRASVALAPLLYTEKNSGGRFTATLLGAHHADEKGDTDMVNALGILFHRSTDGVGGTYTHAVWPLFGMRDEPLGKAERLSSPTLTALETTPHYTGFRFTPIVSVQNADNDEAMPRTIPHLIDFRSGDKHVASWVFPFWMRESTETSSDMRFTPFFSVTHGIREPDWREWCHLYRNSSDDSRSAWSFTPLVEHASGADRSSTRVSPFFVHESAADGAGRLAVFPFYSDNRSSESGESAPFIDKLCLWHHDNDPVSSSTAVLWALWRESEMTGSENENEAFFFHPGAVKSRHSVWTPVTEKVDSEAYRWKDGGPSAEECRTIERWLALRKWSESSGKSRSQDMRRELEKLRAESSKILIAHAHATERDDDAQLLAAAKALAKEHTVVASVKSFEVDPFGIPIYREHDEADDGDWSFLFGLAHGERVAGHERTKVLRYLYDREKSPEGVRMNCFPFVQYDSLKKRDKFAFLWRVFDRETDKATGETRGHILFIPY